MPWFQQRPTLTISVSAVLAAAITVVMFALRDRGGADAAMLFTLPISLIAVARGVRAGVAAAAGAASIVAVWAVTGQTQPSLMWWASLGSLLFIGFLLGEASDGLHRAEQARLQVQARQQSSRQAAEVNDALVQGMAAAKWAFEGGDVARGLSILEQTLSDGHRMVSDLLHDAEL